MTTAGNAAEVFPREHPGREEPGIAGRILDWTQHYIAHVTWIRRLAAHVTAPSGMDTGCGATILEGVVSAGWRVDAYSSIKSFLTACQR